ncbi:hypothetical protein Bbelb_399960 [Branchiostoma belcheri]|nr:hypothetical protein Bbelb_399960 [Branchiostoma belcheri]
MSLILLVVATAMVVVSFRQLSTSMSSMTVKGETRVRFRVVPEQVRTCATTLYPWERWRVKKSGNTTVGTTRPVHVTPVPVFTAQKQNWTKYLKIRNALEEFFSPRVRMVKATTPAETLKSCLKDAARKKECSEITPIRHYSTCALVGNSGILLNGSCGDEIDTHDFVIRFNLGPLQDSWKDVGRNVNMTVVNQVIVRKLFLMFRENKTSEFLDLLRPFNNSVLLLAKGAGIRNTRFLNECKSMENLMLERGLNLTIALSNFNGTGDHVCYVIISENVGKEWRLPTVTTRRTCFCVLSTCKNVGNRTASVRGEYHLRTESYGFGSTQTRRRTLSACNTFSTCGLRMYHPCVRVRATRVPRTAYERATYGLRESNFTILTCNCCTDSARSTCVPRTVLASSVLTPHFPVDLLNDHAEHTCTIPVYKDKLTGDCQLVSKLPRKAQKKTTRQDPKKRDPEDTRAASDDEVNRRCTHLQRASTACTRQRSNRTEIVRCKHVQLTYHLRNVRCTQPLTARRVVQTTLWSGLGVKLRSIPTTGLLLLGEAITFCDHVTLFGFYPFNEDRHNRRIPYHYWRDFTARPSGPKSHHTFVAEYKLLGQERAPATPRKTHPSHDKTGYQAILGRVYVKSPKPRFGQTDTHFLDIQDTSRARVHVLDIQDMSRARVHVLDIQDTSRARVHVLDIQEVLQWSTS